jgi:hypothetical protein
MIALKSPGREPDVGTFPRSRSYSLINSATDVGVGDFNGDGVPDVVTVSSLETKVAVLFGRGDGTFLQRKPMVSGDHGDPYRLPVRPNADMCAVLVDAARG